MDDDLRAHAHETVPWRTDPPPPRRWPLVVLVILVTAAAAGAGIAAYTNYEAGSGWQRRAEAQETRAEAAEARVSELEDALGRVTAQLDRSEADVALLESRLADLASEKAGAEDTAALAAETAEDLTDVTIFAADVGAALRTCVGRNVSLLNDIIASYNSSAFDPTTINARIADTNDLCAEAEADYGTLRDRLDALGS